MMFQVKVSIAEAPATLSDRMEAMRVWLDERRCEPTSFRYTSRHYAIVCRVDFPAEADAAEFACAFDGKLIGQPTAALIATFR